MHEWHLFIKVRLFDGKVGENVNQAIQLLKERVLKAINADLKQLHGLDLFTSLG